MNPTGEIVFRQMNAQLIRQSQGLTGKLELFSKLYSRGDRKRGIVARLDLSEDEWNNLVAMYKERKTK